MNTYINGLVRGFPKDTNFAKVRDGEVQRVQDLLNYPSRKTHRVKRVAQVYEKTVVGGSAD